MSNDDNTSQWGTSAGDPERGPSFQDPTHPTAPAPVSAQDWDNAWGNNEAAQPAPEAGWGGPVGQPAPPMQGTDYGQPTAPQHYGAPGAQATPYVGGAPGPYGGQMPQGQNPYPPQYPGQDPYAAQGPYPGQGYQQQPYGAYGGGYSYGAPAKSKTTAALLAFFLGGLGIHDFYLGKKNLGIIHLALAVGGFLVMMIGGIAASASGDPESPLFALIALGYLVVIANSIWAFVEFIMILVKPEHELGR